MKGFLNLVLKACFLISFVAMQSNFVLGQFNNTYYGNGTNNTGFNNSFFGNNAGLSNTGANNAYFGDNAGSGANGGNNSFFGQSAGSQNLPGNYNTLIGNNTQILAPSISVSTAIGAFAAVSQSNSLVLGSISGVNGSQWNTNVGIGTTAPQQRLHVVGESLFNGNGTFSGTGPVRVIVNSDSYAGLRFGLNGQYKWGVATGNGGQFQIFNEIAGRYAMWIDSASNNIGIGTTAPQQSLHVHGNEIMSTGPLAGLRFRNRNSTSSGDDWVWYSDGNVARFWRAGVGDLLSISTTGVVKLNGLGTPGFSQLCRNGFGEISNCGSSIRYKSNVTSFTSGLDLIRQLRPVSFNWKQNDLFDFGLVAEEVAAVEPLLATYNDKGEVEGVKYDRVGVVLVNAVNEQQSQIESLQKQISEQSETIKRQQTQLDALKKLVCSQNRTAEVCQ